MSYVHKEKYFEGPEGQRYRIKIVHDEDPFSPRDADNPTTIRTFDRDYNSPDPYDELPEQYGDMGESRYRPYDMRRARKYAALDPNILLVKGVDRNHYDGSLVLSDGDDCAGYIAITRKSWEMCMGDSPLEGGPWLLTRKGEPDPENKEGNRTPSAEEVIRQEIESYNKYARGEYVGYVVEAEVTWQRVGPNEQFMRTWETVDSVWGYDDVEYAMEEAKGNLPGGFEEVED